MTPARHAILTLAAVLACGGADAQVEGERAPDPVETYLADRELNAVLGAYLRQRLDGEIGRERIATATRLGKLYAELLDTAATAEQRAEVESLANQLLETVPMADSYELRLHLAKARYLIAETQAENHRLRLLGANERREAEATLRAVQPVFQQIGQAMHLRVGALERAEASGSEDQTLKDDLRESRRLRSLAMYYAGWSEYFLGLLTGLPSHGADSLKYFGWILSATPGQPPTPDSLAKDLLSYDHIARAALGAGLSESLRGNDITATRWLDLVDESDIAPVVVKGQVFPRRVVVLATASRWSDLDLAVTQHTRALAAQSPAAKLEIRDARLLAVVSLEALTRDDLPPRARPVVEQIATNAMASLVEQGETGQILGLVRMYGSAQLGKSGFIVDYVRGLHAFDLVRDKHVATGSDPASPTADPELARQYREVAASMRASVNAADARRFPRELAQAGRVVGLSLLYAGDLLDASRAFEQAYAGAADHVQAEELLWLAVASLDLASDSGVKDVDEHRKRVASVYVQSFPGTERAASLVLRSLASDALTDAEAIDVLLGVPIESPLAQAAKRQAGQLLYKQYRASRGRARDAASDRYVVIADEVMREHERELDRAGASATADDLQRILDHVRQYLDVVLGASTPDVQRAQAAMSLITRVESHRLISMGRLGGELAYRRLQIALITGDQAEIDEAADRLRHEGDRFAQLAGNVLFKRSLDLWRQTPDNFDLAREVVKYGSEAADRAATAPDQGGDAAASIHDAVAEAADAVYGQTADVMYRSWAIEADRAIIDSGRTPPRSLRRLARLGEEAGELETALDMWRRLSPGLTAGSDEWYEARYHLIRLLARIDLPRAHQAMAQHKVLYPQVPEPWGARMAELDAAMAAASAEGRKSIDKEPAP